MIAHWLSPERRTRIAQAYVFHAPAALKRLTSRAVDFPIRRAVRESPLLFIHIPKNAGTNISTQLYGGHIGHRTAQYYRMADRVLFDSKFSFAISRDPLNRFLSAFRFIRSGGSESVQVSATARAFLSQFSSPVDFASYLADLTPDRREQIDPVFQTQARYVLDRSGEIMINEVFRLEDVAGREFDVGGTTVSLRHRVNAQDGAVASNAIPRELSHLVRTIYACDYALLGYE